MVSETSGSATVQIGAGAEAVWALVADVERMGEWSPETYRAEWISEGPAVGALFRGFNRMGDRQWSSECEILACSPGEEFAFHVLRVLGSAGLREMPPEGRTIWRYTVERIGPDQVRLTESFESPWMADPQSPPAQIPGRREALVEGCQTTLARLKQVAEQA